ncbi:MAG TPA: nucleotidyltransferase family protein [Solirubrobacteraceae bacterium]|jgi:hypothetical protein|nr:nucleotidyltransferase family protein [Solirubrobacteraceae bacterium]
MASPAEVAAAQRLRVDSWTAEVVRALRAHGVRPILLKGPSIVRWLYSDDPGARTYVDSDLIVSPADTTRAWAVVAELGFQQKEHPRLEADEQHARVFRRARDGARLDLHRGFHGLQSVPSERAWRAIATGTATISVGGADIEIPSAVVRTLLLILHLGPSDEAGSKAWEDLARGLERVTADQWRAAGQIARELDAEHELAERLRRVPGGAQLANELGLTQRGSTYYRLIGALQRREAPDDVFALAILSSMTDNRARLRYIHGKLWPDSDTLRRRSALARRGARGLAMAHATHITAAIARVPRALAAWRKYGSAS